MFTRAESATSDKVDYPTRDKVITYNSDRTWKILPDLKFIVIIDFFDDSACGRRYLL